MRVLKMNPYEAVKQDLGGLEDVDKVRHGKPLEITDKRDYLLSAYQMTLKQAVLLRAALLQREGK